MSMTGFATRRGTAMGYDWVWDVRSVNGKGFDLRLRLPDWVEGLEAAVRAATGARVSRGNVTLGLRLARGAGAEALRGVLDQGGETDDTTPLLAALLADFAPLLEDFTQMRAAEGRALSAIIAAQIDRIAELSAVARDAAEARRPLMEQALRDNLARVLAGAAEADPARVAQELALMAVKADVTEELDRLGAHVTAARALLRETATVGRRFDFLTQEFMREANTLCSKSGSVDLTRIGLDLKTVIDQMREQVQNVE